MDVQGVLAHAAGAVVSLDLPLQSQGKPSAPWLACAIGFSIRSHFETSCVTHTSLEIAWQTGHSLQERELLQSSCEDC